MILIQEAMTALETSEKEPSLTDLVQSWLERTPGLELEGFNFWGKYQKAVNVLLEDQTKLAMVMLISLSLRFLILLFIVANLFFHQNLKTYKVLMN